MKDEVERSGREHERDEDENADDAKNAADGEHLEPVPPAKRTWTTYSFASMWIAAIVTPSSCITGAALLALGSSLGEIALILTLATIILLPCFWANGTPGAKYGVAFPVYCRASFGYTGAVYAALSRGVVAIGWLSFQLWVGAQAMFNGLSNAVPSLQNSTSLAPNLNLAELLVFIAYIVVHMVIIWTLGPRHIERGVKVFSAVQIACVVALLVWALVAAPLDTLLAMSNNISSAAAAETGNLCNDTGPHAGETAAVFRVAKGVTAAISGWSTMALNIADLSRYASSQRSQVVGQSAGFIVPNIMSPLIGTLATCASIVTFGATAQDWSVVELFNEWPPAVGLIASLLLAMCLLSCNLLANVVSPANDIANICPSRISFRFGAMITLVLAGCTCPWVIFSSAASFVTDFLIGYSSVTGALLGIMLADYFLVRRQTLSLEELYDTRAAGCRVCRSRRGTPQAAAGSSPQRQPSKAATYEIGSSPSDLSTPLVAFSTDELSGPTGIIDDRSPPIMASHHLSVCGINLIAVVAVLVPLLVVGPGFVNQLTPVAPPPSPNTSIVTVTHSPLQSENPSTCPDVWDVLYGISWFVTLALSVGIYTGGSILTQHLRRRRR